MGENVGTNKESVRNDQRNMITGFYINVYDEEAKVVTVPKELSSYYKLLDCTCIDIQERKIGIRGNHVYDIICDDEALLRDTVKISAIDDMGNAMLAGNLFIVKDDGMGEEVSLSKEDIDYIRKYILLQGTREYPNPYPMLHQCEYY